MRYLYNVNPIAMSGGNTFGDPSADPQWLAEHASDEDGIALENPNMPLGRLGLLASAYPHRAEKNPILPLLALEDPVEYKYIINQINAGYIAAIMVTNTERFAGVNVDNITRLKMAATMVARGLDAFERMTLGDMFLRNALTTVLNYIKGVAFDEDIDNLLIELKNEIKLSQDSSVLLILKALNGAISLDQSGISQMPYRMRTAIANEDAERTDNYKSSHRDKIEYNEMQGQANVVRHFLKPLIAQKKRDEVYKSVMRDIASNAKTKADIDKALSNANAGAAKIAEIMSMPETEEWPFWLGVGLVAGTAVLVVTVGPEMLMAGGVAGAAEVIAGVATAVDIPIVVTMTDVSAAAELGMLISKLQQIGIVAAPVAAEVIMKVTR